ncbi:MAG: hypothetical protein KGJ02_03475 [Verrucomicrobiota bacterium]|nr:hypothetical protein [Verrucomicrobiota bacterium]
MKHLKVAGPHLLSRVYLLCVPDDFERGQLFQAILRPLLTPDHSLQRFSGEGLDQRAFFDHLQTPSLFGGEPIAVLDEVEKLPKKSFSLPSMSFGYLLMGSRGKTPLAAAVEKEGVVLDLLDEKPWEKEKRQQQLLEARAKSAGKTLTPEVIPLLFERLEKESSTLESELDKLICYVGDKNVIDRNDVLAISAESRTSTIWHTAEDLVWEGKGLLDESEFHALVPALRSQLQLGLKIATLLSQNASSEEWSQALPRVFPRTLEKRTSQAAKLGLPYFVKGLEALFDIELKSRTGSQQYGALLDLFRARLVSYAR